MAKEQSDEQANVELSPRELKLVAEMTRQFASVVAGMPRVAAEAAPAIDHQALAAALATAIREGSKDPIKEAQRRRAKVRGEAEAKMREATNANRVKNCTHMYPFPYVGITRIAFAMQSDGKERGYCPHCGGLFVPEQEVTQLDDAGNRVTVTIPATERYEHFRALPRHPLQDQPVSVGQTY
jgi:hypothetical protein